MDFFVDYVWINMDFLWIVYGFLWIIMDDLETAGNRMTKRKPLDGLRRIVASITDYSWEIAR